MCLTLCGAIRMIQCSADYVFNIPRLPDTIPVSESYQSRSSVMDLSYRIYVQNSDANSY